MKHHGNCESLIAVLVLFCMVRSTPQVMPILQVDYQWPMDVLQVDHGPWSEVFYMWIR